MSIGTPWITSWAAAQHRLPRPGTAEGAGRFATYGDVLLVVGGADVRVVISNECGESPLLLTGAVVASQSGEVARLTFGGQAEFAVTAGSAVLSDPCPLRVGAGELLRVTVEAQGPLPRTLTGNPLNHGFDLAGQQLPLAFVARVDVTSPVEVQSTVVLGDGTNAGDLNTRCWVSRLRDLELVQAQQSGVSTPLLNLSISGGHLLRPTFAPSLGQRVGRDLGAVPGARRLWVSCGLQDLLDADDCRSDGYPWPGVASMITAYRSLVEWCQPRGIAVWIATLGPFAGSKLFRPRMDEVRRVVNGWIRQNDQIAGVLDVDRLLRQHRWSEHLDPAFDAGDHLHLSAAGHTALARAFLPQLRSPLAPTAGSGSK